MMNAQAQCAPMKLPGSTFAGMVSGSHQHPPQQQQMVPHGFPMGIPRPPVAYQTQVPPMQAQPIQSMGSSEPGIVRIRQDSKKTRKGRKQGHHLSQPPPMITDSNEYPELPASGPGAPYGAPFVGFPQASPFSNILQQRLNPNEVTASDISFDVYGLTTSFHYCTVTQCCMSLPIWKKLACQNQNGKSGQFQALMQYIHVI